MSPYTHSILFPLLTCPPTAATPTAMHTPSHTLPPGIPIDVNHTRTLKPIAQPATTVARPVIIQTIVKLWNKSKESLMSRSKTKQVRVSPKVPPNNQESIDVYQCYMQRVYNRSRTSTIKEPSIKKQSLK
jgi:hypothetical protein